jgi:SAM-dependent methyltransferase
MQDDPTAWTEGEANRLELRVLSDLLGKSDRGSILEIGAGAGRLLDLLTQLSGCVVAIDLQSNRVRTASKVRHAGPQAHWLVADGHQLPIAAKSFPTVVLVRVLHLSPEPERLLAEIRRVLTPGGTLVLSYYPRPSIRTFQYRFWKTLRGGEEPNRPRRAAECSPPSLVGRKEAPRLSASATESLLRKAGFELEERVGTGFEEISGLNRLPYSFILGLYRMFPDAWGYPARFARVRVT